MKNKIYLALFLAVCLHFQANSQESFIETSDSTKGGNKYQMKENTSEIDANFLSSYYTQDGNNSPVTGGIGTEKLTDFSNVFIINIPLNKVNSLSLYTGVDNYTSASTDNIDSNVSSASRSDTRFYGTVGYNKKNLKRNETYGIKGGFSKEFDYSSMSMGLSYSREWNNSNSEINFSGQAFLDKWLGKHNDLIYPELWLGESFGYNKLTDPSRDSYNAQLYFSQVINTRLTLGLSAEIVYMKGLLSTPFHRVYFKDIEDYAFDIERLPSSRLKIPIGLRLNYYPLDFMVIRSYYRYYTDDFGINGNTFEIETPLKLTKYFTLSPFFRYHQQSASKYFEAKGQHLSTEDFYTSDFDLSKLTSQKYGIGLKYYPLYGIFRSKTFSRNNKVLVLKYIEMRGAYYTRSNDFTATDISLNLAFSLK